MPLLAAVTNSIVSGASNAFRQAAARGELNSHAGRPLTDAEWAQMRARLLEFVTILRTWERQDRTNRSGIDNVVLITGQQL